MLPPRHPGNISSRVALLSLMKILPPYNGENRAPSKSSEPLRDETFIRRHAYLIPLVLEHNRDLVKRYPSINMPTLYLALIDELARCRNRVRDVPERHLLAVQLVSYLQQRLINELIA